MKKEDLPCYKCIVRAVCQNKTKVECSELFFMLLKSTDFDKGDKIANKELKKCLKEIIPGVDRVVPGQGWQKELKIKRNKPTVG